MPVKTNVLLVKVKTSAREDSVVGWEGEWLKVKIKAVPEKGRANQAVRKLLARQSGVEINDINIVSGLTSNKKKILVPPESLIFFKKLLKEKPRF